MASKTFGDKVAIDAADLARRSFGEETNDCRSDVDEAIEVLEKKTLLAKLDWLNGASITAIGGDIELQGRDLLAGQTFDELTIGAGASELVITALKPGDSGISVIVADSGGGQSVTLAAGVLTILADDGTTTANEIATLININAGDADGILRCASGGGGTVHPPAASAPLIGGVGAGFVCRVSGIECLPINTPGTAGAAAITDTQAEVTVPNLTTATPARAVGEFVGIDIESDGVVGPRISAPLA